VEPNNRAGKIADPPAPSDGFGVVITGATKGVGFAIAREFLRRGDRVCICGRAPTRVDAAVAALRHEFPGSCVSGMKCDVTDPRDVDAFGDYAASTVGVIHHWLNNAGMVSSRGAFYLTLVPIRPRQRGERRSLRTFPGVSLRPGSHAFNPDTPRRLSTPLLTPFNSTPTFARTDPRP
jgi:NAD(P)-dependent dehydrogenase (short-subunit alcohol dehydrogenase family)